MIIIERHYDVNDGRGGKMRHVVIRRAFNDDAIDEVNKFLSERSSVPGEEWHNLDFKYKVIPRKRQI